MHNFFKSTCPQLNLMNYSFSIFKKLIFQLFQNSQEHPKLSVKLYNFCLSKLGLILTGSDNSQLKLHFYSFRHQNKVDINIWITEIVYKHFNLICKISPSFPNSKYLCKCVIIQRKQKGKKRIFHTFNYTGKKKLKIFPINNNIELQHQECIKSTYPDIPLRLRTYTIKHGYRTPTLCYYCKIAQWMKSREKLSTTKRNYSSIKHLEFPFRTFTSLWLAWNLNYTYIH